MGKRPSKPTRLKILEGNRGKRNLENEPEAPTLLSEPPEYLDDIAKEKWGYYLKKFEQTGLITEMDYDAFAFLCHIISTIIQVTGFINKENKSRSQEILRPDPDGGVRKELKESHYSSMLRQYYGHFRMYAKEFGLTPVGRVGLKVNTGGEEGDDL